MTDAQLAERIAYIERWEDGGLPAAVAFLEQQAADAEAWAARSPCKGGKRKARALAMAKELRAEASQLRTAIRA